MPSASSAVSQTPQSSSGQKKVFGASKFGAPTAVLPVLPKTESTRDVQSTPNKSLYDSGISASNGDVSNVSPRKMSSIQQRIEQLKMKSTDSLSSQTSVETPNILETSQSYATSQTSVEIPNIPNTIQSYASRDSCFSDSDVSSIRSSTESTFSLSPFPGHKPEDNLMGTISEGSLEGVRVEPEKETPTSKVYKVALEILTTEIHYVKILGLIETVSS